MDMVDPKDPTRVGVGEKQGYRPLSIRDEDYHCPVMGPGRNRMVMCFQPTPEELKRLFAGEPVRVSVLGNTPFPIMVDVGM